MLGLVAIAAGAIAFQNSWWIDEDRPPSADQVAPDGSSLFTQGGIDYFTREGVVIVKVREDAPTADELGLDRDGSATIEALVPLEVRFLGADGAFVLDLVDSLTLTTQAGTLTSVEALYWGNGHYRDVMNAVERFAPAVGWTDEDVDQMIDDLTASQGESTDGTYSALIAAGDAIGAQVSARITVDVDQSVTTLHLIVEPL